MRVITMGLQAIEATSKDGNPVFRVDQDTGDITTAHWAARHGVSFQREGASIAFSATHWLLGSKTVGGSRGRSRVVARASVAAGVCVLGLFVGAVWDDGLCGESKTRAQAFVAPTEKGHKIAQPDAMRDESLLISQVVEMTVFEQKQILERGREEVNILAGRLTPIQRLDAAQGKAAQSAPAWERKQGLEREQEWDRAEALARALTSSLQGELDAVRSAAEAARIKQKQALEQERDRAGALARELTSLRAELDMARAEGLETARTAEAAKLEQKLAFGKEREKNETLTRELASARKEAEARSALLAAAHADVLQARETNTAIAAEQKLALASERDRADALTRELTSVRNKLEAGNWQIAALNAFRALHSREPAVDSSQERMAESSSRTIEAKAPLPEQISGEAVASTSGRSSASELPRPEPQSTAHEAASDLDPKVGMGTERSTSASDASRELRLLARANALLRQADISGARPVLEHALERGSARAGFMLAETYDARVLQSWRARGISGDLTKARELYERAQAGGIEDAKERIETLK